MGRGEKLFACHYEKTYGRRWPDLLRAMQQRHPKVALWNRHAKIDKPTEDEVGLKQVVLSSGPTIYRAPDDEPDLELPQPPRDEARVPAYYLLDLASVLVVEALQVEPFHKVLDLCASPGGKSIAVSQYLAPGATLTANDMSADRCRRLKRNLEEHIPSKQATVHEVVVTQKDGTNYHNPMAFDRVLVDAPCSSERHLVAQPEGLSSWTPKVTEEHAALQTTLLLRGLETLKVGGRLVYSTCSISPAENDEVVAAVLEKTRCGVEIEPLVLEGAETTVLGASMHFPDTARGMGPMYCCVLTRVAEHREQSDSDIDLDSDSSSD